MTCLNWAPAASAMELFLWALVPLFLCVLYLTRQGKSISARATAGAAFVYLISVAGLLLLSVSSWERPGSEVVADRLNLHHSLNKPALETDDSGDSWLPNIDDPTAVNPQDVCPGYVASNVVQTQFGLTADLTLAGSPCNVYGTDVEALTLTVEYQAADRLNVAIVPTYLGPSNTSWFILPDELISKPTVDPNSSYSPKDLSFVWSNDPTFSFKVIRQSTGDVLFSTTGTQLVFENQFIELASALPENYNLYGLGEVFRGLRLGNNLTRTFWNADIDDPIDYNLYGSHAFYLDTRYYEVDSSGNLTYAPNAIENTDSTAEYVSLSHGVFMRNSNGQEVLLRPSNITWRTIGGSIDLYFYAGPSQVEVTQAYQQSTVGLPTMQQYWTFGFHQCRWGYANWSIVEGVVADFKKFGIPLETMWTDIDYMNQYRDFENDQNTFNYTEGARFISQLHADGQHYVPIVDSAIYVPNPNNASDAYPTFNRGLAANSFMKNPDGSLYIGSVWPGYTVFPDWIGAVLEDSQTFEWWANELALWYQHIAFDGIWIDMSEVSSFCAGSCGSGLVDVNPVAPSFALPGQPGNLVLGYPEGFDVTNATEYASAVSASIVAASTSTVVQSANIIPWTRSTPTPGVRDILSPPYTINNIMGPLDTHCVSPNATHNGGTLEYDYHNLFGLQILNATYHALLGVFPTKRPFIIGRSTFAGSGKWAGHWGGDNISLWPTMYLSIPQALSFSLFGVPMFGVDTCGFEGNTDEELCNRWMQLSAFFPFYRNHNIIGAISQEPYRWASVAEASIIAMQVRYALLPYMYTLFHLAHETGSTVMRALSWEFPNDPSLASADRQFLLGPSIMVTPVLLQGATTVNGVFPGVGSGQVWYDWYNQSAISVGAGQNVTIDAPLGFIPVYIRGGSILPVQEALMTTKECRNSPWAVLAALDNMGSAVGQLYLDDGESISPDTTLWVDLLLGNSTLHATAQGSYADTNPLANVTIMGVQSSVSEVTFNGANISSGWDYNSTTKVLSIKGLDSDYTSGAWSADWVLEWQ